MNDVLISVIYDGINNSVFEGQVLQPLIKKKKLQRYKKTVLVSFESIQPTQATINKLFSLAKDIDLVLLKKFPFIGSASLIPAIYQLKKILNRYTHYSLVARGPFASFICSKALKKDCCTDFTMQARGLCTEEYRYSTRHEKTIWKKLIRKLRTYLFYSLEKAAYKSNGTIEAVSDALKEHLVTAFRINEKKITVAQHDIPNTFDPAQITTWRNYARSKLKIHKTTHVYCFNGSMKPWQCPEKLVAFFIKQYTKNDDSFLLILSKDKKAFEAIMQLHAIPPSKYVVLSVDHTCIYHYLSAADTGIIFREKNIINWTSRPTKILEYQAVGLQIVHNNTIAFLAGNKLEQNHKTTD